MISPCQSFDISVVKHDIPVDTRPNIQELEQRLADFSFLQDCFEEGSSEDRLVLDTRTDQRYMIVDIL
jgi:hypothetical protein